MGRVACYIDGFNLYHAIDALRRPYLKWVNLRSLSESLLREGEELVSVKYFSAYATWMPDAYARHRKYVAALESVDVVPVLSHFKKKKKKCFNCGDKWWSREEKETDVRLALHLIEDAIEDICDRVIIVSADSDLVPPIETLHNKFPSISTLVAAPPKRLGSARGLCAIAKSNIEITPGRINKNLFPGKIIDLNGRPIERPVEYAPSA